jgi:transcriptional regulator
LNEPPEFTQKLVQQIVAFRIPIDQLEGKWKLNQNRPVEQRERVIKVLSQQNDQDAQAIAELMRELPK